MLPFNSHFANKIFYLGGKSLSFSDLFLSFAVFLQLAVLTLALAIGEHERKTLKPLDLKTVVNCNLYTYRYFILSSDGDENIKETCGRIYAEP